MSNLEITIIENSDLEKVVTESGVVLSESDTIKAAYLPFLAEFQSIAEQARKINTENPTDIDEKISRELRLKTVKIRTGAEAVKDDRKKIHMLKGNLEQASYNLIKNTCLLAEDAFTKVEKAREIAEKKRQEELKATRVAELSEFTDNAEMYPLGGMTEEAYNDLLSGFKLKREADIKAEAERVEALRLEEERKAKEAEAMRLENERLKKEAEIKEKQLQEERAKAEKERQAIEDKNRKEREAAEKKLADERKKQADEAAKLKAQQDAIIKAEQEKAAKLAAELKAKEDAERAEIARKEKEEKERIAAEKKAAKAPDKDKLNIWVSGFSISEIPNVKGECAASAELIKSKFDAFKIWAFTQVNDI